MARILFVDDDKYFADQFLISLQTLHNVRVSYDAERAVHHLLNDLSLEGAVIDVMMPCPLGKEHETHDGNTTGVWILEQAIEEIKSRRIAILLYTNRGVEFVREQIAYLELDPAICSVRKKGDVKEIELPHVIGKLIDQR